MSSEQGSNDEGLSIFDEEPESYDDQSGGGATPSATGQPDEGGSTAPDAEATQVMPAVSPTKPDTARPAPEAPAPPVASPAPTASAAPAASAAPSRPAPPMAPLPQVRRGGYDKAAVDQRIGQLASDRSALSRSLSESEQRVSKWG